jgi:predicted  nucleic acid-binding Zn-ribbon protein
MSKVCKKCGWSLSTPEWGCIDCGWEEYNELAKKIVVSDREQGL